MMNIPGHRRNNADFGIMFAVNHVRVVPQPGVLICRPQDVTGESHRRLQAAGCRLYIAEANDDLDRALARAAPLDAMLAASLRGARLDRERLSKLPDLRVVAKYTIGVDDVDIDAATELGILVTHSPTEANWGGVAEGTIALMLALLKKLEIRSAAVKAGGWRRDELRGVYLGSRDDGHPGIVLGIVGLGRVGSRVAELMAPWKVRLLAADPYVEESEFARLGVERVGLERLLQESDVVSIHCALTPETANLISKDRIAAMRRGAILINTARGRIVDVDAVCDALDSNELGGAAFDVLPEEPPLPGSRILECDARVLLSPHMIAANQGGTLVAAVPWATDVVVAALRGVVPEHVCNPAALTAWQRRFGGNSMLG